MANRWVVLAGLLLAARGWAETAVVALEGCQSPTLAAHTRALREALGLRPAVSAQGEEESMRRLGGAARGSLADADRLIAAARADLVEENRERAERTLLAAAEDLQRLPPSDDRWRNLVDVYTLLAWIHLSSGRAEEAERWLERIYRVDPSYSPSVSAYAPSLRRVAQSVRARVKTQAKSVLRVASRPAGLPVFVEGKGVGRAPVRVQLSPGEYSVEASYGGRRGLPRTVKVEGEAALELDGRFEGSVFVEAGPCFAAQEGREGRLVLLARMSAVLGVDAIVAVREEQPSERESYLVVSMVDARTGEETREAKVRVYSGGLPPGTIQRLADFLAPGEASPPIEPVRGQVVPPPPPVAEKPVKVAAPPSLIVEVAKPVPEKTGSGVRTGGFIAAGAGVALAAGAGFFYLRAAGDDRALSALRADGAFEVGTEERVAALNQSLGSNRTGAAAHRLGGWGQWHRPALGRKVLGSPANADNAALGERLGSFA